MAPPMPVIAASIAAPAGPPTMLSAILPKTFPPPIPPSWRPLINPPIAFVIKPMSDCCVCPEDDQRETVSTENRILSTTVSSRADLGLISRNGIVPNAIQILDYQQYLRNEEYEISLYSGGPRPYPPDPNYPSDPRSDIQALTPVYRNGQSRWLDLVDLHTNHGPAGATGYVWYDWDGTVFPAYSSDTLTVAEKEQYRKDWYNYVWPGWNDGNPVLSYGMRGLKQLYDEFQPFADETAPTVREIEIWNDQVLNLFRRISGMPPAVMKQELFIMANWTQERKTSTLWDEKYPGTFDSAYGGPCIGGINIHCGTTFKPTDIDDQAPYWNDYYANTKVGKHPLITLNQASEGVTVWYNGNAMVAMSRNLHMLMRAATAGGMISGHGGPYLGGYWYGLLIGRAKWAGSSGWSLPPGYSY